MHLTVHYFGSTQLSNLLEALLFGKGNFEFIESFSQADSNSKADVVVIDCNALTKNINLLKQLDHIYKPVIIIGNSVSYEQWLSMDIPTCVRGIMFEQGFKPEQMWHTILSVSKGNTILDPQLRTIPDIYVRFEHHFSKFPKLKSDVLFSLIELLQAPSVSHYAKEKNIARSTIYRRIESVLEELGLESLSQLKYKAISEHWI